MKKLLFKTSNNQEQQFAIAVRKNVYDYFKEKGISPKGNIYLVVKTFTMFFIYLAPFVLILTVPLNRWIAMSLAILMGFGMAGIGMCVMHDAAHNAYSKKEWINQLISKSLYLLGSNVYNWKLQHNVLHHVYTNIDGYDNDIKSRIPLRFSKHSPLHKIHRFQHIHAFFFYGLLTISRLINDLLQMREFNKEGITRKGFNPFLEYFKIIFIKLVYLTVFLVLPIMITPFSWLQILLGFFIMHFIAGCILSIFFQMAHMVEGDEQPLPNVESIIENEWVVHEMKTTSDLARNNHFLNWYVGGLNFQIEHHLFTNISHVHYKKIAPIVEKTAIEFGINYNLKPTFFAALASHVRKLKELGTQESKN
jgi:linoleoyl-CoA desaturase